MVREIETQRLRLLRLVAGLAVALGFLSIAPISAGFSVWVCGFVVSTLSRAEVAARYLVVAKARRMMAQRGIALDVNRLLNGLPVAFDASNIEPSVGDCRARLRALQAVLTDLPRHAVRLLRRIEKQHRDACAIRNIPHPDAPVSVSLPTWRLAGERIERPPDFARRAAHLAAQH